MEQMINLVLDMCNLRYQFYIKKDINQEIENIGLKFERKVRAVLPRKKEWRKECQQIILTYALHMLTAQYMDAE